MFTHLGHTNLGAPIGLASTHLSRRSAAAQQGDGLLQIVAVRTRLAHKSQMRFICESSGAESYRNRRLYGYTF